MITIPSWEQAKEILAVIRDNSPSAVLCGGFAMYCYGSDRFTADIDVLVASGAARGDKQLSIGGRSTFIFNVPVDMIERNDEFVDLYEEARETAQFIKGVPIRVVQAKYLFVMKWHAWRNKDRLDAAALIRLGVVEENEVLALARRFLGRGIQKQIQNFFLETHWRQSSGLDDE